MIVSEDEIARFASDWIAETIRGERGTRDGDDVFADQFIDLTFRLPDVALAIALKIAELSDHPWVLENLGAGALETILHQKKEAVLPVYEAAGNRMASFREALDSVWPQGSEKQEHWLRFYALREELRLRPDGLA
ncbi:MAG: hypothetical protein V4759_15190 [Pseudomonadota bacterium]